MLESVTGRERIFMSDDSKKRVFFDSNVIVYAQDTTEPWKRERAQTLICDAFADDTAVISGQVLGETFVTLVKKLGFDVEKTADEIRMLSQMKVVEISSSLVLRALQIKIECQLSYWDSLIIAAAEAASCETVWSEDLNDGQIYGSVTVRNPFK